jgi:hypothetical protein
MVREAPDVRMDGLWRSRRASKMAVIDRHLDENVIKLVADRLVSG